MPRIAAINAIAFFFFWLLVLYAGADKPPPRGFLWLVLLVALCATVVYRRVPTYINWSRLQKPGRLLRVVLEGLVAGLIVAAPFAISGSGEPTLIPSLYNSAVWFIILGILGMLNACVLYGLNAIVARREAKKGE